jgi:cell division septum initiation protein DivIVA
MTKSQEIQILSDAADKLGSDSYCGAWLREQIPFIESDIRSDFAPGVLASASIQDCARRCAEMRADAMRDSDKILSDARKEADQIRAQAVRFNELQREELRRTLKAILSRID